MPARAAVVGILLFASACSSGRQEGGSQDGPVESPEGNSLGPYSARVVGEVTDCAREDAFTTCTLRVEHVPAYGPSTHPLPPGIELEVRIHPSVLERDTSLQLVDGSSIDATLHYLRPAGVPETSPLWIIERIHSARP